MWTTSEAAKKAERDKAQQAIVDKWTKQGKPSLDYGQVTDPEEKKIVDDMNALISSYMNAIRNLQWERAEALRSNMDTAPRDEIPQSLYDFFEDKGLLD
jgi:hypothetical protein